MHTFFVRQKITMTVNRYEVRAHGTPIGGFRKDFAASLLRSTWHLSGPGLEAMGRERRPGINILRRLWGVIPYLGDIPLPFVFHFDFADTATGTPVLTSERQRSVRDRYPITVSDPRLDFRVAASMAVALDALQSP